MIVLLYDCCYCLIWNVRREMLFLFGGRLEQNVFELIPCDQEGHKQSLKSSNALHNSISQ